jgi:hypothetical protein
MGTQLGRVLHMAQFKTVRAVEVAGFLTFIGRSRYRVTFAGREALAAHDAHAARKERT